MHQKHIIVIMLRIAIKDAVERNASVDKIPSAIKAQLKFNSVLPSSQCTKCFISHHDIGYGKFLEAPTCNHSDHSVNHPILCWPHTNNRLGASLGEPSIAVSTKHHHHHKVAEFEPFSGGLTSVSPQSCGPQVIRSQIQQHPTFVDAGHEEDKVAPLQTLKGQCEGH